MSDVLKWVKDDFGFTGVLVLGLLYILFVLATDLAKLRTTLQQQMATNLLDQRFKAYGELWSHLKSLALYSAEPLSAADAAKLRTALSSWYFSAQGGMFLSARARDFYFALQESLNAASKREGWQCSTRPYDPKTLFHGFLKSTLPASSFSNFDPATLDDPETIDHKLWLDVCKHAARELRSPDRSPNGEVVFAFLQQVSSALRTILAADLQSRLDLSLPRVQSRWRR